MLVKGDEDEVYAVLKQDEVSHEVVCPYR